MFCSKFFKLSFSISSEICKFIIFAVLLETFGPLEAETNISDSIHPKHPSDPYLETVQHCYQRDLCPRRPEGLKNHPMDN